jgi:hypothetical protein
MSPRSRRALAGAGLAGAPLAATLGLAASPAAAAVTGRVRAGTLEIMGDRASDRLALRLAGATDLQTNGVDLASTAGTGDGQPDTVRIETLGGDHDVTVAPDVAELITPVVDLGADG